ncbi:heavy metal-responsive transcriptional regulator [Leptodesmis sichuanensis]|uniref:heavy metal-responsive transcriptional regulator n=1 Tax=Leptodesmis sichuanensis TaxID=2906798 RepID=UPI001F395A85|nr:heavy metal-responsive transcriptional regulator [Leptodesmis sichuanensis]UIE37762.1 heavy metal-responsive transcriptional regulator [Leptodesmis sichuanensis A121]
MFQVGEVSRRLGLNPQTLYFYERIGLMPSPKRTAAGYRLYEQPDLERLSFITQAKALGLSLDDIKDLLMLQDGQQLSCQEVYDRLLKKVQHIDETINKLQTLKTQLKPLLDQCQRGLAQPAPGQQCVVFQQHPLVVSAEPLRNPPLHDQEELNYDAQG